MTLLYKEIQLSSFIAFFPLIEDQIEKTQVLVLSVATASARVSDRTNFGDRGQREKHNTLGREERRERERGRGLSWVSLGG